MSNLPFEQSTKSFHYETNQDKCDRLTHSFDIDQWKRYFSDQLSPFISGDVLEVGAGVGSSTKALFKPEASSWVCLEPNQDLYKELQKNHQLGKVPEICQLEQGVLSEFNTEATFDTILYIDVLEHIENDRAEIDLAMSKLKPNGKLIILSPAYQWLYSEFDLAVGHYRRYHRQSILKVIDSTVCSSKIFFLDSLGILASLANKWILKQANLSEANYKFFNTVIITISRWLDPLFGRSFGRSIVLVAQKR